MEKEIFTIKQILLLEKMRREEGLTEAQYLLCEKYYKDLGYEPTKHFEGIPLHHKN